MDRLQAFVLVNHLIITEHVRIERTMRERRMAGEIRKAMEDLRAARGDMVTMLLTEIAAVKSDVAETRADGLDAMKLPRAELAATKQEIAEIRAEFAPKSNGDPNPGPLPGVAATSPPPSLASADSASVPPAEKKT